MDNQQNTINNKNNNGTRNEEPTTYWKIINYFIKKLGRLG